MAFRSKSKKSGNDKYLRLTGMWQSKNNDALWTGRLKEEQIEALNDKVAEALDAGAPLCFSLWENDKKESKRDPEFSLQCFVGDSEEKPRSSRRSNRDDRDDTRRKSRDEDEEEENNEEPEENSDEEEETPRKKGASTRKGKDAPRGKSKKESW